MKKKNTEKEINIPEEYEEIFEEVVLEKNKTNSNGLTKEQQQIIDLKSKLMIEKIKNTSKEKKSGYFERKRKRRFRDTEFDKNATTKSLLRGGLFMAFSFGMIILLLLIIS